ncbi:MAG: methylmalonyl-CoA mutase, partial [Gemmatimonadetes bacterium]|nr:methylmalonyl-CoA mutase [Gemmatimonadota bacterium]
MKVLQSQSSAAPNIRRIDDLGGVTAAIDEGFFVREIAQAAYRHQREVEEKERIIVGVNEFVSQEPLHIPRLEMDAEGERRQLQRLQRLRRDRDNPRVSRSL